MGDAGEIIMGRFGRELLGIGQLLFLIFVMASHVLTFTVLMNTITEHGTCTIVFGVIALIVSCVGALPRTMDKVYWMSIACKHIIGLLIFHTSSLIMGLISFLCSISQHCGGNHGHDDCGRRGVQRPHSPCCDYPSQFQRRIPSSQQSVFRLW